MKKKFIRNIILSKTPLATTFRFKNTFQIFPCDFEKAPKSKNNDDIPLIIEYWIDEEENVQVSDDLIELEDILGRGTNTANRINRITRLLTAITNHRFYSYFPEKKWGTILPEGEIDDKKREEINNQSSETFIGRYTYPSIKNDMVINDFSKQNHPDTELIEHSSYYFYNPLDSKEKQMTFPNTIYDVLEKYFALDSKSRKIVDTVSHLICNGIDLRIRMKSMSFLSFVSSIETLVNYEYKDLKDEIKFECYDCQTIKSSPIVCPKCGRPIWGVKAKFKNFLQTYASKSESSISKYNRIYNLRSDIVHNGLLLLGDEQIDWTKSNKVDNQYLTHIETMQLARFSLVNWLLMKKQKK